MPKGAVRVASDALRIAPTCTEEADEAAKNGDQEIAVTTDKASRFRTERDRSASRCTSQDGGESKVHPTGFEPVTFGFVDRRHDRTTTKRDRELCKSNNREVPVLVPSLSEAEISAFLGPELARIRTAWGDLRDAIKSAILVLVGTAPEPKGGADD